ncbi:MAG TPA: Hsp20/alpha crystallin family protein [Candidatus Cloacimonadota bacterium]|jgi:HSP20 family protein|nr:Hsp20/alpha crystallin family protein [Candidatus Cloacimonadales bacterium]HPY96257.1 Hsp20/alpha crystallin family protein [Candidatus Cloacimonadota bacterium]HQB40846.1 Hsp20/alpha crystallin family protein [Candidatus Cloacimonadota bacterium]
MKLIPIRRENMPMWSLFGDMMDRFLNEDISENAKIMAIDVLENPKSFDIKANLPGIPKEKINISIKDNRIVISASHEEVKEEKEKDTIIRTERYSGSYQRTLSLPENCDTNNISAKLENGVLSLSIPKREPTPKKEITIQ